MLAAISGLGVTANDEFLAELNLKFKPRPRAIAGFVTRFHPFDELRELRGLFLRVPRDKTHFFGGDEREHTNAIVLRLKGPVTFGDFASNARVHWLERGSVSATGSRRALYRLRSWRNRFF